LTALAISVKNLHVQTIVTVGEAKAGLSDLLRRAEAGEEIIVTRNGDPVAQLGPIRPRTGGFLRGEVVVSEPKWWHPNDGLADAFGT
jgi:prevent-host-death family protein